MGASCLPLSRFLHPMHRIIVHSYPNNEIRAVFCSMPPSKPIDYSQPEFTEPLEPCLKNPPLSLGLNSKPVRSTVGYGSLPSKKTVFGLNAKRQIVRSGAAMEKSVSSPSECIFLTGTLPGSTPESFAAIASYSAYIVNNLKAWIAKRIPSKLDFYCWEYQKRGALHFHYCIHAPDSDARLHILDGFREWWINTLKRVGSLAGVDLFRKNDRYTHLQDLSKVRAVAEICRKSPSRYMAKYLSKTAGKLKGRAIFFTPSRWWGVSRPLKKILDSLSTTVEIMSGSYFSCVRKMQEIKQALESTEGLHHVYPHKYGMGETSLIYPANGTEFDLLLQELQSMSVISMQERRIAKGGMTQMIKPYKIRLLRWSSEYSQSLEVKNPSLSLALKEFKDALYLINPSTADSPLHAMYELNNLTFKIREVCMNTPAMYQRIVIEMFELALFDFESVIKILSYNSDKWID